MNYKLTKVLLPRILLYCFIFCAFTAVAQPTADFLVDTDQGCAPLLTQFVDQSTGTIVDWSWELGAADAGCNTGPTTQNQNPGRIFTDAGVYCICLTVTDDTGATDTECKTDFINVFAIPIADFDAPVVVGCSPLTVDFSDISIAGTGAIVNWQWDLNNGNCPSNNSPNISCTYDAPGSYDIALIVTDENGCSHFIQKDNFITVNENPDPDFTADQQTTCQNTLTVDFTPTIGSTTDMVFAWDFGDGGTSTDANPTYTFNNSGSFPVTLVVTNSLTGCQDSLTQNSFINVGNPVIFDYSPEEGCPGLSVSFTDQTAGNSSNWLWDFGDGTTGTSQNPDHVYDQPGCYTVSLTADSDGCSGMHTAQTCIEIFNPPSATYTATNLQGCLFPHTSTFSGSSADSITNWSWDFGDGNTGSGQNVSHDYNQFGTYPVALTVTSMEGCTFTTELDTVRLSEFEITATVDSTDGCAPRIFNFEVEGNGPSPISTVDWDFGNGTMGTGLSNTVTYPDTGTYTIIASATNIWGCTATASLQVEVGMQFPVFFSADPLVSCAEETIDFVDESEGPIDEWFWDFGDGGTSIEQNPTYTYQDTGLFTVCLTIINNGCEAMECKEDYIQILPPIALFTPEGNCINPYSWDFIDNSIGADVWAWDFGVDGIETDTSSLVNPTYVFPDRGVYVVTLVVTNNLTGCTYTRTQSVEVLDPLAVFTVSPDTGCAELTIPIINNSIDASTYAWSAPGGSFLPTDTTANPSLVYTDAGVYSDISLIITDNYGCLDTLMVPDSILVSDVYPGFLSSDPSGCRPIQVSFTDTSSTFGAPIVDWFWDFGNGQSTDQNPTNEYTNIGQHDISLTVTNALGCSQTTIVSEYIDITYPNIQFTADTFICTDQTVVFNNTSIVSEPGTYFWDFGDGNTSDVPNPVHTYAAEGIYSICLTGTDRNGCDSTLCKPDYIRVGNPTSDFVADVTYASCPPLLVNFTDLSINAAEWEWDFGDNSANVNTQNAPHIYTEPGSYDVCLYITSASGCVDTLCYPDYILIEGPTASFSFAPDEGCAPLEVTMIATGEEVVRYTWDSGCGDLQVHNVASPTDTAVFVYDQAEDCYPILVVEDSQGCQRTYVSPDPITVDELNVDFTPANTVLCEEGTVLFESLATSSVNQVDYLWRFPGGNPATSTSPTQAVFYDTPGVYEATLIVTSGLCVDSLRRVNVVQVADIPQANFTFTPNTGCEPQAVNFTNTSGITFGTIDSLVWDFGTGDSVFVNNPQYNFDLAGTYTVTLWIQSSLGCENTISQVIDILPVPTADAGPDQQMCQGETVMLSASGGDIYAWSPTSGLSCTDCAQPEASPGATTDYVLTITAPNGCTDTDTVHVDVIPFPVPTLNVTGPTSVCEGEFVQITATSNMQDVDYFWDQSREGLSCYEYCFNPFAYPEETTTYLVTVVGPGGCSRTDSITVEVVNEDTEIAGQDRTICAGETVELNVQGGSNPIWSPFSSLSCASCPNPIASPTETMTYYISATSANGCALTDSITVTVMTIDDINAGDDQTICLGEVAELTGDGKGIITWSPPNTLSDPNALNTLATPSTTTNYTFSVVNDLCELEDQVTVFVRDRAEVATADTEICLGDTAILNAFGFADTFNWTSEDGIYNNQGEEIEVIPDESTSYIVVGTRGDCLPDTAIAHVTVQDPPALDLPTVTSYFEGGSSQIDLEVEGNGDFDYLWSPSTGLNCITCEDPIATPDSSMVYQVLVTDNNGCEAQSLVRVVVKSECNEGLIVVPNAFTPNGDGQNDVLYVRGSAISAINIFRIYDRWGTLVFETSDRGNGWDGTYEGKKLNPGVFVYYVEAPCIKDGSPIFKKGNITMIR